MMILMGRLFGVCRSGLWVSMYMLTDNCKSSAACVSDAGMLLFGGWEFELEALSSSHQERGDVFRFAMLEVFQMGMCCSIFVTGSSMIVEVTDLLHRATLKVNSINPSDLADPDSQDFMARYHFLCAWMVGLFHLLELLQATKVYRHWRMKTSRSLTYTSHIYPKMSPK